VASSNVAVSTARTRTVTATRRKPRWIWISKEDAAHDVLDLLAPWLSARRRAQAEAHDVILDNVILDTPST
jgi:hypothetical protein